MSIEESEGIPLVRQQTAQVALRPSMIESPWTRSMKTLRRNRLAMVGVAVIVMWTIIALTAPYISPYDPIAQNLAERLREPSTVHLFGTDELGRDTFSRILYGARISLPAGIVIIAFALLVGSALGAIAGYLGGALDMVIMRIADVTLAFPSIVLALAIAAVLGPSLTNAMIAMIVVWWPEYARLMRGQVLATKNNEYVAAARVVGVPNAQILVRHIIPNTVAPLIVKASLDVGVAILTVAALSFIGLGAVPPTPEWGAMISAGRFKFYNWWLTTFPGLAMLTVVLAFNFLGDGVRDALDPRANAG